VFVSDDDTATVGTINLDYRSLYLHFECGVFIYNNPEIDRIEKDFKKTLKKCHKVTLVEAKERSLLTKLCGHVLRMVAPLM
jgi:cardiolipin synthase